jgi:LmbE family N-acetylglucosaminyl deacetylase
MLTLQLPRRPGSTLRILCLGAHSDDIEIGCGGTLLHLLKTKAPVDVEWMVFSGNAVRAREARRSARALAAGASSLRVTIRAFRDGYFPSQAARIKEELERLKRRPSPDLIFCPRREDAHQDHRVLGELTWNTFRDHLILEYEIAKYDGDLGSPNVFVPLEKRTCRAKVDHLRKAFASQAGNQWFTDDAFLSLLRLRGIESNAPSGYAEGFYARKVCL